ncbi:zinc-binding dehydrogenase [Streptomyces sp. 8N616]|uniref:zinc-binding dehydrogenase n=1 Tax=Streptomyces sp. 8N616 TaxID=3457414 RepID=UPI003FD0C68C
MRAVWAERFGGPDVLVMGEAPDPVAGPGEVVVEVSVAPLLFVDTQIRRGLGRDWFDLTPPYVPGAGVAGQVISAGEGVDPGWAGRRVVTDTTGSRGGYAGQAAAPAEGLIAVPEGLGPREAAALLHDGRTAMRLAELFPVRRGERVLVLAAAGGLGTLLVQLAHAAGATVIGAARGKRKLDLVRELGADAVVDYSEPGWSERVRELTGGGPEMVFDGAGGQTGREAFEVTAPGGRFSAHGTPGGGFSRIGQEEARQRGVTLTGIEQVQLSAVEGKRLTGEALSEAAAGRIRPVIGRTFPLERVADAHAALEAREILGKALLLVR